VFRRIHAATGYSSAPDAGGAQHLVQALISYIESNPEGILRRRSASTCGTPRLWRPMRPRIPGQFPSQLLLYREQHEDAVNKGYSRLHTPLILSEVPDLFPTPLSLSLSTWPSYKHRRLTGTAT
jgi:hypothetical protein